MLNFRKFNVADWFSFYRIVAAPLLVVLLLLGERQVFTWLLLVSFTTDMIDGFLARTLKITSPRGSQLDSLGDQSTLVIGVAGLLTFEHQFIMDHILLILVAFIPYILQMLIAFIKYGKATAFHTYLAKLSAIVQGVFILYTLFFSPLTFFLYTTLALGVLETVEEITLIFMHREWRSDVKGIYWALKERSEKSASAH
jgi:CDP-diacylglycerol--glycerol-3-phosphate 3-phosphatidyltransferase